MGELCFHEKSKPKLPWKPPDKTLSNVYKFVTLLHTAVNLFFCLISLYGNATLQDVDERCIGGCVAKSVCTETEELKFFNTINLQDRDVPIYKVCHPEIRACLTIAF